MPLPVSVANNSEQPRTQAERTALAESSMILAAIDLLNSVGIQGTTLVAIGERSGYSRGLASHHFGSKSGLLRTVLKRMTAVWTEKLVGSLDGKTGLQAFTTAIDTHLEHVLRHPDYIRAMNILWGAALDPASEFKPNVAEFMRIQRESVAAWVKGGQASGEIRPDIDAQRMAEQFYGTLIGLNNQWLVAPEIDLRAAYEDYKQNILRLLSAKPPPRNLTEAYIYDHVRSPRGRGKANGSLHSITPTDLTTQVLRSLRDRNDLDTSLVDDVILGCVAPIGEQGANIARTALLNADYAECVIMAGQSDIVIGGGIESMSRLPMGSDGGSWPTDPQVASKLHFTPQGIGADLIATIQGFSREDIDGYALESQKRAAHAWDNGYFSKSILPIKNHIGEIVLDHDEHMRPDSTMESLATLKPAFVIPGEQGGFDAIALLRYPEVESIEHVHTAANSSGIVDGAAAVLLGSAEAGERMNLKPRARIRAFSSVGSEPTIMLTGPIPATEKVLRRAGMSTSDIDLFELNEAFTSVVMLYMKELNIPHDKINVNGGAIAMGHPLGATGAMILGTVLDELERRDLSTALVTLCIGAGMGTATIIERV